MTDRCTDCGYPLRIHFGPEGQPLGCPIGLSSTLGHHDARPRVTVRVGKVGARRGHVFVAWPDCLDRETNQVLVWDLQSDDQFLEDQRALQTRTRRPTQDQEREAIEEVEYRLGGDKVRAVRNVYAKGTEES